MVQAGRTPVVPAETLKEWGFNLAIYPGFGFGAAAEGARRAYAHLKDHGSSLNADVPMLQLEGGMHVLMGFPGVWEFEKKWAQPRSEEHTSELQSLMRTSYAVSCLKKTNMKSSYKWLSL